MSLLARVIFGLTVLSGTLLVTAEPANPPEAAVRLTVATSAELNPAVSALARTFEQKSSHPVQVTVEALTDTHSLLRRPFHFDAVFSNDSRELQRLVTSGAILPNSVKEVARDRLVICISPLVRVEFPPRNPLLGLKEKAVSSIAIPDPHRVYGRAAEQALKVIKIYSPVIAEKLAVGNDVSDVAQSMKRGDASVALLPESALETYSLRSTRVIAVATNLYPPIRMEAGLVRRSQHLREASKFLQFSVSKDGKAIFRRSGFSELQRAGPRNY